jgi:isoleucyl-tRNA synthetase
MSIQRNQMKKLGLMTNYNEYYVTTDKSYEAEQIRMFSTLVKKGVVYRGYKPIQWSWSHRTALAENEIEYINKKSKTLYFKLELEKESKILENNERKISFLA